MGSESKEYIIKIECATKEQAELWVKSKFKLKNFYDVEKLEDAGATIEIYSSMKDIRTLTLTSKSIILKVKDLSDMVMHKAKPTTEPKKKEEPKSDPDIILEPGMSLNKFLEANPKVRTIGELSKYFSQEVISKGMAAGVFFVRKGVIKY